MEIPKPEDVEKQLVDVKAETEQAEVNVRRLERNDQELTIKDVEPNQTYEKNGYTYQTDSHACPVRVSGYLHKGDGGRTPQGTDIGHMGNSPEDVGGHIIGKQFEGPTDAFNIRPQDGYFNNHEYKNLETEWANALKEGKECGLNKFSVDE